MTKNVLRCSLLQSHMFRRRQEHTVDSAWKELRRELLDNLYPYRYYNFIIDGQDGGRVDGFRICRMKIVEEA